MPRGSKPGERRGGRKPGTLNKLTLLKREAEASLPKPPPPTPEKARARRDAYYRRTYGISVGDYEAMETAQGSRCACCGSDDPGHWTGLFCVDHDHGTGAVRDLLCITCNSLVGFVEKQRARVMAAIAYADRHATPEVVMASNGR